MGVNVIGRYMKNSGVNCAIETNDPSIDINHCSITVSRDKKGNLKYVLKDGPSYTGTFVDNVILGDREQRVIEDGTLFTIGATSVILHTDNINDTRIDNITSTKLRCEFATLRQHCCRATAIKFR